MRKTRTKAVIMITALVVFISTVGGALFVLFKQPAVQSDKTTDRPTFVFDAAKAPGWWTAGTTYTKPEDFDLKGQELTASDIPIASISIHRPQNIPNEDSCFAMLSYFEPTADPAAKLAEMMTRNAKFDMTLELTDTKAITMDTFEGPKTFQLYLYDMTGQTGGNDYLHGNSQGYLALKNGYVDIRTVCKTADQLQETLGILRAITLKK